MHLMLVRFLSTSSINLDVALNAWTSYLKIKFSHWDTHLSDGINIINKDINAKDKGLFSNGVLVLILIH
jgi:hypothetical protein